MRIKSICLSIGLCFVWSGVLIAQACSGGSKIPGMMEWCTEHQLMSESGEVRTLSAPAISDENIQLDKSISHLPAGISQ